MKNKSLIQKIEDLSIKYPTRIVRIRGTVENSSKNTENLEIIIYRGFTSSTTHPTKFDPEESTIPENSTLIEAELLLGPLNPNQETIIEGPIPIADLLTSHFWLTN